jgi:hypothetical protein
MMGGGDRIHRPLLLFEILSCPSDLYLGSLKL